MIQVKCFRFEVESKIGQADVAGYSLDEQYLDVRLMDGRTVTPYLHFIPTENDIPLFDLVDMVEGCIADSFNVKACSVSHNEEDVFIKSAFTLEFGLGSSAELKGNVLTISQDDGDYRYAVEASFTEVDSPSFIKPVSVQSGSSSVVAAKASIEAMTM
ncbi:hypothetical protein [Ferrimonas balearica]|uniref:hypothetical protein n=1 Tax=Ferrimonas balearica TaxID=44012 RepID=UPI001C981358|nr:hypothetical protein [Ferrimonas balearica]MBY5979323.1 hypothetical protein [Ferrimonas balearica]